VGRNLVEDDVQPVACNDRANDRRDVLEPLVLSMRLTGQATQPAGEPPKVDVRSETEGMAVEGGEGAGIDAVSYETQVTFTSETTFTESGRVAVGSSGDALLISAVGEGYIAPSADPAILHGAVTWRIDRGEGALQGASGLITSNFQLKPETGDVTEYQVAVIFR
jgi:hypothetical protein